MFEKRPKYVGNDVDLWEMAQICGEMTYLFDKLLKNVKNDLENWLQCLRNGQNIYEMGNGSNMWGNDLIFCQTS